MQHADKQMFKLEITIEEINVFIHLWVKRSIEVVLIPLLLTLNKLSKSINIGISIVSVFTKQLLRVCLQISLLKLRKFKRIHYILFPQNHQKEIDFLMISAGIQVYQFTEICLVLEAKFRDDHLSPFLCKVLRILK